MSILIRLALQRALEMALEALVPLAVAMMSVLVVSMSLSEPWAGRVLNDAEVFLVLALPVALLSWSISRGLFLLGYRKPTLFVLVSVLLTAMLVAALPFVTAYLFEDRCLELKGRLLMVKPFDVSVSPDLRADGTDGLSGVCQLELQMPTAYRSGAFYRPVWRGVPQLMPWGYVGLTLLSLLTALGLRDKRLRASRLGLALWENVRLLPGEGSRTALLSKDETGKLAMRWDACANATLWGEPCGHLYPEGYAFGKGESCARCGLVFRPSPTVTLSVISLRYGDLDMLNNLEHRDARVWKQGDVQPHPPDSAEARWVDLGEITLPDVLSIAQALALLRDWLNMQGAEDASKKKAIQLAQDRASQLAAWCWFHDDAPPLKQGIPTRDVVLATGTQRLRDVYGGHAGWKGLQLDIGLLPLDLRLGLWKPPEAWSGDGLMPALGQRFNNRQVFWIPTSRVAFSKETNGLWVPRVEGAGLRAWLTVTSRTAWFKPTPYAWEGAPWSSLVDYEKPHDLDTVPLSLVRLPPPEEEPISHDSQLGCRLSEWDWLDRRHLELLRRQAVFMAPYDLSLWDPATSNRAAAVSALIDR